MSNCGHHDHHTPNDKVTGRLLAALAVIATFMVVEIVGGIISGSLALLADAAHMLTDALALALAVAAQFFAARPADSRLHFGYRRAQVLAAFVNGLLLGVLLLWIIYEAISRFIEPVEVASGLMLWVAIAGLAANAVAFLILHRPDEKNVNMRGAILHVLGDMLGSVAAIIAAIVIGLTGWMAIDPILSIAVAVLIGISAFRLVKETGFILLEGAPTNIDVNELGRGLVDTSPEIIGVHHVQISQITPEQPRLTMHVCVANAEKAPSALASAKSYLERNYNIHDSTIQIEIGPNCPDGLEKAEPSKPVEKHEKSPEKASDQSSGSAAAFATPNNFQL
ncbi:cation diffusion facilitator family transporter [Hyphococcus sp. DH-69]|uniref:cation diffusion facilitator family transporter n=1 Tax=Hyphococcus formosus TaxID=3143534 RepID=UPI00398A66B1